MTDMAVTYMLRTCNANMGAWGGFLWPASGPVTCPDWSPEAECGHGLHGLLMGAGDAGYLSDNPDAKWLVVEVYASEVVDIDGKVKVPRTTEAGVVFCGDRTGAVAYILARGADPAKCVFATLTGGYGSTLTGGDGSTLTGGDGSTLTGGDRSTLTGGYGSTLTGGDGSTLTGGYGSTLTGGYGSTLTGGYGSTLICKWWDGQADRYRTAMADCGDGGIEVGVAYRVVDGRFERVVA